MPGFLLRSLLFLLIGTLPLWLLVQVSKRYPPSSSQGAAIERLENLTRNLERLEAISIGSSHAQAIAFEPLGLQAEVVAMPWGDVAELDFEVRTLVPRMPSLHTVFIPLSYFSFHWANEHGEDDRLFIGRRLFYAGTPFLRWIGGDLDNFVIGKSYWLVRSDNWQMVLWSLLGRLPREDEEEEEEVGPGGVKMRTHEELVEHAERRMARKLETMARMKANHPEIAEENYATLSAAIRLLQERGVRVVLFTPPYYPSYRAFYEGEPIRPEMRALAQRLSTEHGVEYYDFSEDEMSLDPENFRDSDHLNVLGQERFASKLAAAMRASGLASGSFKTRPASSSREW